MMMARLNGFHVGKQDELIRARRKISYLLKDKRDVDAQVEELQMEKFVLTCAEEELIRARHKIGYLLKDKRDVDAQVEELQMENYFLTCAERQLEEAMDDLKEKCNTANRGLKKQNRRLQKQRDALKLEVLRQGDELAKAKESNRSLEEEVKAVKMQNRKQYFELKQASEDRINMLSHEYNELLFELDVAREAHVDLEEQLQLLYAENKVQYTKLEQAVADEEQMERLLAVEHTTRKKQDRRIASLMLQNSWLEEDHYHLLWASCRPNKELEPSMLAEVEELKKKVKGLRKKLKQAANKLHVHEKEHGAMMQKLQMEQRMSKLEKANKSKTKRRRRASGKVEATSKLAEGTGDVQLGYDAEAVPSKEGEKSSGIAPEVEDEAVTFSESSQPYGVIMDTSEANCPTEGEVERKETNDTAEPSQRKVVEVVTVVTAIYVDPTVQDSEDLPFSSSNTLPPSQQDEVVVQATKESAGITSPSTDWAVDFPCGMPAGRTIPLSRKRRHSYHKLTVAAKRRSALIYRVNSTIANYKQHPALLRVLNNWRVVRDKNQMIAKLKEEVQFLSELHGKGEEGFMKVSVDFQQICEQFIPRDNEIHQLVISQLPQIVTGQDFEYWFTVLQAVLGLSTAACSSRNWQSMFQHWLSGRGSGPPIWKTLFDVLETSGIKELQRIARFLKARLHEFMPCSRLEEDGRCIACGQLFPRSIREEEDKIFISQEESTNLED